MSPQMQGTPQDEQAIRTTTKEFVSAWNRHDVNALAACFAADGDLIDPAGRVGRGRGEVERILKEEQNGPFKGSHVSMPQKHLHFLKPDLVIADYECEVAQVRGADGKELTLKELVSTVLRKEGDKWLIVAARPMIPSPLPGNGAKSTNTH